ncbi:MFS transporter [Paraburkholderia metrosideri]|uniref:MFS transporter n=1 Tax=Paraburkholderia metrosideri TaxID=580937 RepID=A0ABW9DYU9_9BURK
MTPGETMVSARKGWSEGLTKMHWKILLGSFLGWIFDGYEALALIVVMVPLLHTVLTPAQSATPTFYAGLLLGMTLLGWGIGGLVGGVLADYLGRKKVMLWSVFLYACFSGITAAVNGFWTLCALRFLIGLAMGSEWSTGIALVSETWPERARAKGAGFLQSGYGWGTFLAASIWYVLSSFKPLGPDTWRLMFLIGAVPAIFVLYLRRSVKESAKWEAAVKNKQWTASSDGSAPSAGRRDGKRPFPLAQLFREPEARRRTLLALILSVVTSVGWWAISTWLPVHTVAIAKAQGIADAAAWGAKVSIAYTVGAIVAYTVAGFIVDAIGRRAFISLSFAGCFVMTIVTYWWVASVGTMLYVAPINGFFTLGCAYVWMAIYPAELFPSSVRASAISLVFNGARLLAWVFPIIAGEMIRSFGGASQAALAIGCIYLLGVLVPWFMPETRDRALPD